MISVVRHRAVTTLHSQDGQLRLVVEVRADGLAQFIEERFYGDPTLDDDHVGWQPIHASGLYASAGEAKQAAGQLVDWLRPAE